MPVSSPMLLTATDPDNGDRLDRWLARLIEGLSRSRIQGLIRQGAVTLNGRTIGDPGQRVKPGDVYSVAVPEAEDTEILGEAIPLTIVYEDDALIVIDKPAGLVVHPAAGHATGTLVNALIAHCGDSLSGIGGVKRPGIVHRLDKDTSGLIVAAKSDVAHVGLAEQFAAHGADGRLDRRYLALAWGGMSRPHSRIAASLGRSTSHRTRIAVTQGETGRHAVTHVSVRELLRDATGKPVASLLELRLETGRTHQIRVHLAHVGHPVMGDPVYASGFKASASRLGTKGQAALLSLGRQALHAAMLGFEHPVSGKPLRFESPLPRDMMALLAALGGAIKPEARKSAQPPRTARKRSKT